MILSKLETTSIEAIICTADFRSGVSCLGLREELFRGFSDLDLLLFPFLPAFAIINVPISFYFPN